MKRLTRLYIQFPVSAHYFLFLPYIYIYMIHLLGNMSYLTESHPIKDPLFILIPLILQVQVQGAICRPIILIDRSIINNISIFIIFLGLFGICFSAFLLSVVVLSASLPPLASALCPFIGVPERRGERIGKERKVKECDKKT